MEPIKNQNLPLTPLQAEELVLQEKINHHFMTPKVVPLPYFGHLTLQHMPDCAFIGKQAKPEDEPPDDEPNSAALAA